MFFVLLFRIPSNNWSSSNESLKLIAIVVATKTNIEQTDEIRNAQTRPVWVRDTGAWVVVLSYHKESREKDRTEEETIAPRPSLICHMNCCWSAYLPIYLSVYLPIRSLRDLIMQSLMAGELFCQSMPLLFVDTAFKITLTSSRRCSCCCRCCWCCLLTDWLLNKGMPLSLL